DEAREDLEAALVCFDAEDGIRGFDVTGVQTCALPIFEVNRELEDPNIWNNPEYAQNLGRERSTLADIVETLDELTSGLADAREQIGRASCRERVEIPVVAAWVEKAEWQGWADAAGDPS